MTGTRVPHILQAIAALDQPATIKKRCPLCRASFKPNRSWQKFCPTCSCSNAYRIYRRRIQRTQRQPIYRTCRLCRHLFTPAPNSVGIQKFCHTCSRSAAYMRLYRSPDYQRAPRRSRIRLPRHLRLGQVSVSHPLTPIR